MTDTTTDQAATADTTAAEASAAAVQAVAAAAQAAAAKAIDAAPADPWDDPAAARTEIEKLRRENGADRTNAKTAAAEEARSALAQQIGKALGFVADDTPVDPQKLTADLTAAQTSAKQATLELAVYKAASAVKADASALLDSRSFLEQVSTIDPTDSAALAAAITAATTSNPRLKASQVAAVGGADLTGGTGTVRTYTRAQIADTAFYRANKTDIDAAYSEGRITA